MPSTDIAQSPLPSYAMPDTDIADIVVPVSECFGSMCASACATRCLVLTKHHTMLPGNARATRCPVLTSRIGEQFDYLEPVRICRDCSQYRTLRSTRTPYGTSVPGIAHRQIPPFGSSGTGHRSARA
eukprot:2653880-Rhodomonas_salina.1